MELNDSISCLNVAAFKSPPLAYLSCVFTTTSKRAKKCTVRPHELLIEFHIITGVLSLICFFLATWIVGNVLAEAQHVF